MGSGRGLTGAIEKRMGVRCSLGFDPHKSTMGPCHQVKISGKISSWMRRERNRSNPSQPLRLQFLVSERFLLRLGAVRSGIVRRFIWVLTEGGRLVVGNSSGSSTQLRQPAKYVESAKRNGCGR